MRFETGAHLQSRGVALDLVGRGKEVPGCCENAAARGELVAAPGQPIGAPPGRGHLPVRFAISDAFRFARCSQAGTKPAKSPSPPRTKRDRPLMPKINAI